jgi:hypothetical protein
MARKKVSPAQAKAAKQKKIAIGLGVLFLVVAAIQGPRMLKMLKGPATPVAAETTPAATPTDPSVPPAAAALPTVGAPADAGQPAVLASSDVPAAGSGQLLSFELFTSKDPFTQQVDPAAVQGQADAGAAAAQPKPTAPAAAATPADSGSAVPGAAGSDAPPPTSFAPAAEPAAATTISVNDVSGEVDVGKEFPVDDPIFVLVSTAADGKSAQVGIAGGSYANGEQTIKLKLGKPVTLQNTADGTRYELVLETVEGFAPPKSKK